MRLDNFSLKKEILISIQATAWMNVKGIVQVE